MYFFRLSLLKYVLIVTEINIFQNTYSHKNFLFLPAKLLLSKNPKIIIMETYNSIGQRVAKRRRLDFELPNADQIIKNQQQVIENLRAEIASKDKRIQELEDQLKPQKNLESLPNECLLKILSYLSNYDVFRNVAGVSKRFHELSEDKHLIRNIEVNFETWRLRREVLGGYDCDEHESAIQAALRLKAQEEKYIEDLLKVLKRSLKLRFLSLDFGKEADKILEALPMMNHQFLGELCLTGAEEDDRYNHMEEITYPRLSSVENTLNSLKLKNLQELHLNGFGIDMNEPEFKKLLETIADNMPKLQLLCLTEELDNMDEEEFEEFDEKCQEFALAKNIKLEIARYN